MHDGRLNRRSTHDRIGACETRSLDGAQADTAAAPHGDALARSDLGDVRDCTVAREDGQVATGDHMVLSWLPSWTNGIGLLAKLHVAAGVGGGPFLEVPTRVDREGYVNVPDAPGLGIELDESAVRRYAIG